MRAFFDPKTLVITFDENFYIDIEHYPEFLERYEALQNNFICMKITDYLIRWIESEVTLLLQQTRELGYLFNSEDFLIDKSKMLHLGVSNKITNSIIWKYYQISPKFRFIFNEEARIMLEVMNNIIKIDYLNKPQLIHADFFELDK